MPESLTPATLNFLAQAFETGPHQRRLSELRFDFPGLYKDILATNIYKPIGFDPQRLIKVDNGDEWQDGYKKVFRYKHGFAYHAGGLEPIVVDDNDLRLYEFCPEQLPRILASQLGNTPVAWMDQHIWDLGRFQSTRIILLRGLNYFKHQDICNTLAQRSAVDTLVLSALPIAPGYMPLPVNHRLVELPQFFSKGFPVNFERWIQGVDYSWDYKTGTLSWKTLKPIRTRGIRRHIIDYLFESGLDGHPQVNTQWLLQKYNIRSRTFGQYFSGVTAELWNQYLDHDDENCWLRFFET